MFLKNLRRSHPGKDFLLCVLSAVLLILAFPKTDWWFCAWVGLVPLLVALHGKRPWAAFRTAYLCGFLFFAGVLYWFFYLTEWFSYIAGVGVMILFAYLALYFGLFGLGFSLFSRQSPIFKLFLLPSLWCVLEYLRAHLLTGFDWASLGQSQYRILPLIQIADVTGMFGVSFLVVMGNVFLGELIGGWFLAPSARMPRAGARMALAVVLVLASTLGYGFWRLMDLDSKKNVPRITVSVVQGNIPQALKWDQEAWPGIIEKHIAISRQAAQSRPELLIWPETAYSGFLWEDDDLLGQLKAFVREVQIPLLFGSVVKEGDHYYNTAILLSSAGRVTGLYRKIHLVPFGEFLPLRRALPFLADLVDIGDFTPGTEETVFSFPREDGEERKGFSVLICFEDTVAGLARRFIGQGARWLVNITNDAWFGNTRAPYMHLQSSVFRSVENRRSLVRAANTGVSCAVDRWGRIVQSVAKGGSPGTEHTYISGHMTQEVDLYERKTFYTKFGDVFTFFCFGGILRGIMILLASSRRLRALFINHFRKKE